MLFIIIEHDTCDVCKEMGAEGEKASWERLTASSLLFFLLVLLIEGQDQHELPEEGNEIQEEVNAVPDVILISIFSLFNNELSVKEDKAAHDQQPHVQVCLEQPNGSKEKVPQGGQEHETHG